MNRIPTDREYFKITLWVSEGDIDELDHVNNIVYLRWVQDVSYSHWNSAASEDLKSRSKWVVLRHEIDYHAPALRGDEIEVITWIELPNGPRQQRNVLIQRARDGKALASTSTTWCLLDPLTNRPKKVSVEITSALGLKN